MVARKPMINKPQLIQRPFMFASEPAQEYDPAFLNPSSLPREIGRMDTPSNEGLIQVEKRCKSLNPKPKGHIINTDEILVK